MKDCDTIRVLVADDYELARWGLRELLNRDERFTCCGVVENGSEVLHFLKQEPIDVVLMDVQMPELDGVETTRRIIAQKYCSKVIGLTAHHQPDSMWDMLEAGARGYMVKTVRKEQIYEAIDKVMSGSVYLCDEAMKDMVGLIAGKRSQLLREAALHQLTRQELHVLELVAADLSIKEMAIKLNVSPRTVETHKRNMARKLGYDDTKSLGQSALRLWKLFQNLK